MGVLPLICFLVKKLLLAKTQIRIKLILAGLKFYMLSGTPIISLKIVDSLLFTRKILVADPNHQYLQGNLEREPAHYNYIENIARNIIILSRQNQFTQANVSNNATIRRKDVAINTNIAVAGFFHNKSFNY